MAKKPAPKKKTTKKSSQEKTDANGLTDKQRLFCREYLIDYNGTQAAIRAGYSERTAYSISSENLRKPEIQAEIDRLKQERLMRLDVSADRVIQQLARIAFADIREFIEWDEEDAAQEDVWDEKKGWIKKYPKKGIRIKPAALVDGTVINEISETIGNKGITRSLKLASREAALEKLFRYLGLDKPQKIDVGVSLIDLLMQVRERREQREGGSDGKEKA